MFPEANILADANEVPLQLKIVAYRQLGALDNTTAEQSSLSLAPATDVLARLLSVFAVGLHALVAYLAKQNMRTQQISHIEHEQKNAQFCRPILKSE